jgi:hypothetical protein
MYVVVVAPKQDPSDRWLHGVRAKRKYRSEKMASLKADNRPTMSEITILASELQVRGSNKRQS